MENAYNIIYKPGDHLLLELNTKDVFEGDYSDGGKNRIDLVNVKQHNNVNKLGGIYSFYRNEIVKIYRHKKKVTEKEKNKLVVAQNCNNIQLVEEEYSRLKEMCESAIYLEQVDDRCFKAFEILGEAETIGVVCLGIDGYATDVLKLLLMCTWKQVFIFDLLNFKNRKIFPELKDILESEYITKVMHGGSLLINILYKNYKVNVQNVFDTQIVDLILEKSKTGVCPKTTTDISQCLVKYLNFPPSILENALAVPKKTWNNRPLNEEYKILASQLVTYLIPLKEHFIKKLLHPVYTAIDDVHNLYCNLKDYEFSQQMGNKNIDEEQIDNLIPKLSIMNMEKKDST